MNIIQEKWKFLNSTVVYVPKQAKKLYEFGLQTISTREVMSLRSNARILGLKWPTAKSKVWRLTAQTKFLQSFPKLISHLKLLNSHDVIVIDFSDFGSGFQVLMFAKQTENGRALPIYFEILRYPIPKDSQNTFVIEAIQHFKTIFGMRVKLVFDRGFANPSIIEFLSKNQWKFIVRVKKGKHFHDVKENKTYAAKDSPQNDNLAMAWDLSLRLIVSNERADVKEPWYLVTNDLDSTRDQIIDTYYHRFEIEEFFRDAKRLLRLEWVNFKKIDSLSIVLWFVLLGTCCLNHLATLLDETRKKEKTAMELSNIRYVFEYIRNFYIQQSESAYYLQIMPAGGP